MGNPTVVFFMYSALFLFTTVALSVSANFLNGIGQLNNGFVALKITLIKGTAYLSNKPITAWRTSLTTALTLSIRA